MKTKWKIAMGSMIGSFIIAGSALAAPNINLFINGMPFISSQLELKVENGKVWAPIDRIAEEFKGKATYDANKNEVRVTLPEAANLQHQVLRFEDALLADTAKDALNTWVKGVQTRNGSLQYAVFSPQLRAKTLKEFNESYWVTGGSSPHMGTIEKLHAKEINKQTIEFSFDYNLQAQGKSIGKGKAVMRVQKIPTERGEGWFITNIKLKNPDDLGIMIGVQKL
ncbi:hypothetical protein [Aneurinibacillus tyrosinisolvens]|uniref:hypothetical protein n=1 Tax=Aneurinibacillus tyrosinisolvens TaxID=1443435 RepID=UPI00063F1672|nr:hypothetical protein [Aneurinibacillus tyrosinisolvens]